MNKLLVLLASFIVARAVMLTAGALLDSALASLISSLLYILLFICFSPRKRESRPPIDCKGIALTVVFFLCVSIVSSAVVNKLFDMTYQELSPLRALTAVLIVPVSEELFFRATLFQSLDEITSPAAAVLLSALIFSISHSSLPAMITAFILGALLALIYRRVGSVWLPAVCHAANNLLAAQGFSPSPVTAVLCLAVGIVIFTIYAKAEKVLK